MEIQSYGKLPDDMTLEEFYNGKSEPINPELMEIFMQCGIVDRSGHGVPLIVDKYGREAIRVHDSGIIVTIPFDKTGFNNIIPSQDGAENTLLSQLIKEIEINPNLSLEVYAKHLKTTRRILQRIIKNSKRIRHVGPDKGGHYKIIDE